MTLHSAYKTHTETYNNETIQNLQDIFHKKD